MDYFSRYGLPRFGIYTMSGRHHPQPIELEITRTQSPGRWRDFFCEQEEEKSTSLYTRSDKITHCRNDSKKSNTGIRFTIIVLVTFLMTCLVALAVLSSLLFFENTNPHNGNNENIILNYSHHCQEGTPAATECANGWIFANGTCYWFIHEKLSWNSAETVCNSLNATLVEISNEEEFLFVNQLISGDVWVGARYSEEDERSIFSCSRQFSSLIDRKLVISESPDSLRNCIEMHSLKEWSPSFITNQCTLLKPSVCEGNYVK